MKLNNLQKTLFYILQFTWGLPLNIIGFIIALFLIITGHKPKRHKLCLYFEVGEYWGGLELGFFFLIDKVSSTHTKNHEVGHAIQNSWFGPFFLILWIAGAIRYNYRNLIRKINPNKKLPDYDSIWFEGQATKLGESIEC